MVLRATTLTAAAILLTAMAPSSADAVCFGRRSACQSQPVCCPPMQQPAVVRSYAAPVVRYESGSACFPSVVQGMSNCYPSYCRTQMEMSCEAAETQQRQYQVQGTDEDSERLKNIEQDVDKIKQFFNIN